MYLFLYSLYSSVVLHIQGGKVPVTVWMYQARQVTTSCMPSSILVDLLSLHIKNFIAKLLSQ